MDYSSLFFICPVALLALLVSLVLLGASLPAVVSYVLPSTYLFCFCFFLNLSLNGPSNSEGHLFTWYAFWEGTPVQVSALLDPSTLEFSMVLLMLSLVIQVYALNYFSKDPEFASFSILLGIFILFMLTMISTTSWTVMFVTWEGVGLLSFLLVSFWYSKVNTLNSGFKVLFYNSLGDFFFFVALGLVLYLTNSDSFLASLNLLSAQPELEVSSGVSAFFTSLVALSLLLVILSKSAQFGFHIWLLEAMEAPLPASSLIHSATLVCAGAVLFFNIPSLVYLCGPLTSYLVIWSCATSCLLSFSALLNYDIKKVLAYSTGSHISLILALSAVVSVSSGVAYTLVHASTNVFIFLLFGFIIDANGGVSDLSSFGSFFKNTDLVYYGLLGTIGLSSLPMFTLASLKDSLTVGLLRGGYLFDVGAALLMFSAVLNYAYMLRLFFNIFFGDALSSSSVYFNNSFFSRSRLLVDWNTGRSYVSIIPVIPLLIYIFFFETGLTELTLLDYQGGESFLFEATLFSGSGATYRYLGYSNSFFFFFFSLSALYKWLS